MIAVGEEANLHGLLSLNAFVASADQDALGGHIGLALLMVTVRPHMFVHTCSTLFGLLPYLREQIMVL